MKCKPKKVITEREKAYQKIYQKKYHANLTDEQREKKLNTQRRYFREWRKTKEGYLYYTYNAIQQRCRGHLLHCKDSYEGHEYPANAQLFIKWALNQPEFHRLFDNYQISRKRRLGPSIDRIKNNKGYEFSNMQWLTLAENARKSNN